MSRARHLELYIDMLKIRFAEQKIQQHYSEDIFKTPVHLSIGAEAMSCGVLPHFPRRRVYGTYRNHHWFIPVTQNLTGFFLEMLGRQDAPAQGRAGSMHLSDPVNGLILTSAIVSSTLPIALGDCWAEQQKTNPAQTIVFFGDGALEEGVFWETLNFSALKKIPLLFVCEDNELAIHSFKKNRQAFDIKKSVESYGVPYFRGNGSDAEDVFQLTAQGLSDLKKGPVFLHLDYLRLFEHVGMAPDFSAGYREKPEGADTHFDPLWNMKHKLQKAGYSAAELLELEAGIAREVERCFLTALKSKSATPGSSDDTPFKEGSTSA
jgi:acetoin:2,6-dichlorophenolindophenol oxidoreductase subunit alpha